MTDARELLRERRVAPSILATDFAHLGDRVREVMDAGARVIHVDVMDGHFVPPITIGPLIVDGLREQVHDAGGILDAATEALRPGGTLVYSTCTLSPHENEDQIAALTERRPVWEHPDVPNSRVTMPHRDGTAGFFIARLRRAGGAR